MDLNLTSPSLTELKTAHVARDFFSSTMPIIALVSHGGILCETFKQDKDADVDGKFLNCEFRCFDVDMAGNFARPMHVQHRSVEPRMLQVTEK